ncbi:hypothetical protein CAEBREN_10486 [Caenorhabditis brenneri]|uniref:Uncharacterized protein n=1 Tax=Caenorhabditis brenneri TaxID=135651 RepID=G0P8P9_CAEBE|nr:hypothetical protein CAEBREN_10486 [Caenorhabditis brenneri]
MRGLIALIFLINVFVVFAVDQFVFDVVFTCSYRQRAKFNYNVQFFEKDSWSSSDDRITDQKIGSARPTETYFTMYGHQDGDEYWSEGYEVYMILYHDCTEYQKEEEVRLNIEPKCEIGKEMCHFTISKDLKELKGEDVYKAKLDYGKTEEK